MQHDASLNGWRTDKLINLTLVFVTILFAIMVVWLVGACVLHNEKHKAESNDGTSRGWMMAKFAIAGMIFLGVDGNLFVNSFLDLEHTIWNFKDAQAAPNAVLIELNASAWVWRARYAGVDGKFNTADDVVVLNDLKVPINAPVVFQIGATDVLHSVYIPNLRVKQDAVPGTINWAWFQAKETGVFEIGCAQHCGAGHYKMRGTITVLPADEYSLWMKEASATAQRAYDPADENAHWGWAWKEI